MSISLARLIAGSIPVLTHDKACNAVIGRERPKARQAVVCGTERIPTLRLWPRIFPGKIDVFPTER